MSDEEARPGEGPAGDVALPLVGSVAAPSTAESRRRAITVAALGALLVAVLWLKIAAAFLCALATFALYRQLLRFLTRRLRRGVHIAAVSLTLAVLALVVVAVVESVELLWTPGTGLRGLLQLLAGTVEHIRSNLPPWLADKMPETAGEIQAAAAEWLRGHADHVQHWSGELLRTAAHVLLGFAIGVMAAFQAPPARRAPWVDAALERGANLLGGFSGMVAAQLRIASVNAALTGAFLLALMPLLGSPLPLARTLVALTFFAGLIPIIGNLISNTAIVLVALTVSPAAALGCAVFLVAVHKLEYFLNAHFVSRSTQVPAWALLATMLVLEAAFGLTGLVCAPIYAAWACRELRDGGVL